MDEYAATATNSNAVLAKLGRSGSLTTSQANWQAFPTAVLRWATGAQSSWGGGGGGCLTGAEAAIPC